MSQITVQNDSRQYLHTFRQHVLDPLSTAEARTEEEREEVDAERDAYEQFAARVAEIPTDSSKPAAPVVKNVLRERSPRHSEALREAYRETVMAVPHYDGVYDETLEEHVLTEFGPELTELFQPLAGISFTEHHRDTLVAAAEQRARDRAEFCDALDSEAESLGSLRRDLETLLDEFDTSIVPAWYREQFDDKLGDVLHARQAILNTRSLSCLDGHNLCEYLYDETSWTYPVLTAVARLLDSIVVQDENG